MQTVIKITGKHGSEFITETGYSKEYPDAKIFYSKQEGVRRAARQQESHLAIAKKAKHTIPTIEVIQNYGMDNQQLAWSNK